MRSFQICPIRFALFALLCACALMSSGQEVESTVDEWEQQHAEVVDLNKRLRTELIDLNSDIDRMHVAQRWALALVALGAFSLGFVLGYLGRHTKEAAKSS